MLECGRLVDDVFIGEIFYGARIQEFVPSKYVCILFEDAAKKNEIFNTVILETSTELPE